MGMKMTKRQRTLRKLVLPLIAIGMMTTMMALESLDRAHPTTAPATQSQR
jgi:hypothetical protein